MNIIIFDPKKFHLKRSINNQEFSLGDGLQVRITPHGKIAWQARLSIGEKRIRVTLGHYPGMNEKLAREYAYDAGQKIKKGIDPRGVYPKKITLEPYTRSKIVAETSSSDGYIYLAMDSNDNTMIKIGVSENPFRRIGELSSSYGRNFIIFSIIYARKVYSAEKYIHKKFKENHVERELYNISKAEAISAFIDIAMMS